MNDFEKKVRSIIPIDLQKEHKHAADLIVSAIVAAHEEDVLKELELLWANNVDEELGRVEPLSELTRRSNFLRERIMLRKGYSLEDIRRNV